MEHVCNERCSWKATEDSLDALGFPVKRIEKGCFGTQITVNPSGKLFESARHDATSAGVLRLCTKTGR